MTDVLQVMDLVVNGPLKAHMRSFRCAALFRYFQSWKLKWAEELQKPAGTRVMPSFAPPKATLTEGLKMLGNVSKEVFSSPEFKAGIVRAFVKVGLVKESSGRFAEYTSHSRGEMPVILAPADSLSKDQFALGVGELDADSDDDSDGGDGDGGGGGVGDGDGDGGDDDGDDDA
jgi:hypothetical protein